MSYVKSVLCLSIFFSAYSVSSVTNFHSFKIAPTVTVTIQLGDITKLKVDAIVNAANSQLQGGGGVCGAIFQAAGWDQLQTACDTIGSCATGNACITSSFNLASSGIKYIIHAVGPIYDKNSPIFDKNPSLVFQGNLLMNAYTNSLKLANQYKLTSIAFPFISTGIYGFPKDIAAQCALDVFTEYCKNHSTTLTHIHMVLFSHEDVTLFLNTMLN